MPEVVTCLASSIDWHNGRLTVFLTWCMTIAGYKISINNSIANNQQPPPVNQQANHY